MIECLPEAGCGRLIDLGSAETVGQCGRHTQISNKARTVVRVNQTHMMQGRAKREKKPAAGGDRRSFEYLLRHRKGDVTSLYIAMLMDKLREYLEMYSPLRLINDHKVDAVDYKPDAKSYQY